MKSAKGIAIGIVTVLIIGLLALPAGAQSPVTVDVDRTSLTTDEVLTLQVIVDTGSGQPAQPVLPPLDGFELLGSSSGTQISIVNGDMSTQVVYSYSLHPTQEGQLVINPITTQIDGQLYASQPIQIEVSQGTGQIQPAPNQGIPSMPNFPTRPNMPNIPGFPNLNNLLQGMPGMPSNNLRQVPPLDPAEAPTELIGQDFFIEAEVDNLNPFQGEQVIYTFRFYQAESLFDQPEYQSPAFTGFWSEEQPDSQTDYTTEAAGRAYRVTELQTVLFPTVVGEVTIEPASLTIPGDFFTRGAKLQTEAITLNVRPLPDGAPANFLGAVGQFDIQADTDTDATELNETVTLNVTLSGQGNINGVSDPQWTEGPEWRAFDSEAAVNAQFTNGIMRGVRSYERLLVPTQPGDLLLPAIEFSYFNPQTESYETVRSEPIIVTVTGDVARGATPISPDSGSGATINTAVVNSVIPELRPNKPASELGHSSGAPLLENDAFWLLWMLPLFLIMGSFGLSRFRQQRLATVNIRRSKSAAKRAFQALHEARNRPQNEANDAVGGILTRYLAEKLDINMAGKTQPRLRQILLEQNLDPQLAERVQNCLLLSEMGRYAPTGTKFGSSNLIDETEHVITELEKQLAKE